MKKLLGAIAALTLGLTSFTVGALPADATTNGWGNSLNWSGVSGEPKVPASAPVTHVEMNFSIPRLLCTKAPSRVSIWVGMDNGTQNSPLPQTGIDGVCSNGSASWFAWYEDNSSIKHERKIPQITNLYTGEGLSVNLDYRPDIAPDAFVAEFVLSDTSTSLYKTMTTTFNSPAGAKARQRADCIVERPAVPTSGNKTIYRPLAHFVAAPNGAPNYSPNLGINCLAGNGHYVTFLAGPSSNHMFWNMISGNPPFSHNLVTTSIERPNPADPEISYVIFHWLAAK